MKTMMRSLSLTIFAGLTLTGGQLFAQGNEDRKNKGLSYPIKSIVAGCVAYGSSFLSKEFLVSTLNNFDGFGATEEQIRNMGFLETGVLLTTARNYTRLYQHEDFGQEGLRLFNKSKFQFNAALGLKLLSLGCGIYTIYALGRAAYNAFSKDKTNKA